MNKDEHWISEDMNRWKERTAMSSNHVAKSR
jgi:hypothetical protein